MDNVKYVEKLDNGSICLYSYELSFRSQVILSMDTLRWFADFLDSKEENAYRNAEGDEYKASRNFSSGNVTLEETRGGEGNGIPAEVAFSPREIPKVSADIKNIMKCPQ